MKKNNLDAILPSHVKRQENNELIRGLAELAKQCLDMCGSNRPSMKEIADELGRLRKLSLHPWVQVDVEMETRSLLGGASTASFEIEGATSTGYPTQEGESLPMNPGSSYYARSRDTQAGGASDEGKLPSSRPATLPYPVLSELVDGSCSSTGFCQTASDNPRNMGYYYVYFDHGFNTSKVWRFSRFSYAVLMGAEAFYSFSTKYISTTTFNDTRIGRQAPVVMDWAIRNGTTTCEVAKHNKVGTYACLSTNSVCPANGLGYLCNCSKGYQGNPYLQGGCQDVDECRSSPCHSGGVCHNTEGGYRCSCRAGRKFNGQTTKCDLDTGLIIGIGLGVSGGMLLAFGSPFIIRKIKETKVRKMKEKYFSENHGLLLQQLLTHKADIGERMIITLEELEKATNNFDKAHVIGGGGHGIVFKGILDLHVVAIKKSKIVVQREIDEFINEVAVLSQVNHRNVVKLLGCCLETEVPLLVYEFISNGTLYHHLYVEGPISLPWDDRMRIAMEVARALSYLHSATSMPIFHRDIKSSNILLDENLVAKVSDFGASRYISIDKSWRMNHVVTTMRGTIGYLAPEWISGTAITSKVDVYSYGMVLLEIISGSRNSTKQSTLDGVVHEAYFPVQVARSLLDGDIASLVDANLLGEANLEEVERLCKVACWCIQDVELDRPTMSEVVQFLECLCEVETPPVPRLLQAMAGQQPNSKIV
nr:wall-associated receptor kinase 1-like [Setaria viridis]